MSSTIIHSILNPILTWNWRWCHCNCWSEKIEFPWCNWV